MHSKHQCSFWINLQGINLNIVIKIKIKITGSKVIIFLESIKRLDAIDLCMLMRLQRRALMIDFYLIIIWGITLSFRYSCCKLYLLGWSGFFFLSISFLYRFWSSWSRLKMYKDMVQCLSSVFDLWMSANSPSCNITRYSLKGMTFAVEA